MRLVLLLASAAALSRNAPLILLTEPRYRGSSACLDGSPYGLFFRRGSDPSRVLIVLQGGGFCTVLDDAALRDTSCAFRAANNASSAGSSLGWPAAIGDAIPRTLFGPPLLGLTSDNAALNPHLANASLAFLPTCDGSAFSSDVLAPLPVRNGSGAVWLRGRANLEAALRWLLAEQGLASAAQVVLAGYSSGAAAVILQLDHVASLLPPAVRLRGLVDAGFMQNMVGQLGSNYTHTRFANASAFWNASTNAACQAAPASAGAANWTCLVTQTVLPHVQTPLFLLAAAYDDVIPVFAGDAEIQCSYVFEPTCSALSRDWWRQYRNVTLANIAAAVPAGAANGLYVSACCPHCSSITGPHNDTWVGLRVGGVSPADAFDEWLRGLPSRRIDYGEYGSNPSCLGWHG